MGSFSAFDYLKQQRKSIIIEIFPLSKRTTMLLKLFL